MNNILAHRFLGIILFYLGLLIIVLDFLKTGIWFIVVGVLVFLIGDYLNKKDKNDKNNSHK